MHNLSQVESDRRFVRINGERRSPSHTNFLINVYVTGLMVG